MIVIRTAEDLARALASASDPPLKNRLRTYHDIFAEYPDHAFEELGLLLVVQPGDTLAEIEAACSRRLVQVGVGAATFATLPELVRQHDGYIEATFILSDDGFGLVLMVDLDPGTEPSLLAACQHSLDTYPAE